MPHVSIQHFSRTFSEAEKTDLVEALTETVTRVFGTGPDAVSIAVEPVDPSRWTEVVWQPHIEARPHLLWKQPGYTPNATTEGTR